MREEQAKLHKQSPNTTNTTTQRIQRRQGTSVVTNTNNPQQTPQTPTAKPAAIAKRHANTKRNYTNTTLTEPIQHKQHNTHNNGKGHLHCSNANYGEKKATNTNNPQQTQTRSHAYRGGGVQRLDDGLVQVALARRRLAERLARRRQRHSAHMSTCEDTGMEKRWGTMRQDSVKA